MHWFQKRELKVELYVQFEDYTKEVLPAGVEIESSGDEEVQDIASEWLKI